MAQKPQFLHETVRLKQLLRKGVNIGTTRHALLEIAKDGLDLLDVRNALKSCYVSNHETAGRLWRHTVEGRTPDGEWITIVLEIEPQDVFGKIEGGRETTFTIITAWKNK